MDLASTAWGRSILEDDAIVFRADEIVPREGRITEQFHSSAQAGGGPFRVGCEPVQRWNQTSIARHLRLDTYPTL